jgi:4-amino-4-deoxy-L-arabinose transferase-like glycosyltransferase
LVLVVLAAMAGLALQVDTARQNSATYDEPTYLRVASRWWHSGEQDEITRMGTPLTFWKLQYAPVFLLLELTGRGRLVHEAIGHEQELLPMVRIGSLWIWLAALAVAVWWSRRLYGPKAMVFAAWLFALSPNLLAHGALTTMEMPLVATTAGLFALFWMFLETGRRRWFWGAASVCGLAWSCKFTTILYPPILALAWWLDRRREGKLEQIRLTARVVLGMAGFVLVAMLANFAITGFAMIPLSPTRLDHPSLIRKLGEVWGRRLASVYEIPLPQDWVGFANQIMHQAGGGASYLLGERRMKGWWYYYFVALAVKVPVTFFTLIAVRGWLATGLGDPRRGDGRRPRHDAIIPLTLACFLTITAIASSRNYGIRYLLPLAPLAIVWVSALAEQARWNRLLIPIGLVGVGLATATIHPYELTYFNVLGGGPIGGRRILSDSNLDWGQGLLSLARLQRDEPEFRDLTLYYFGDTDPDHYGIFGLRCVITAIGGTQGLPELDALKTRYVGVSASLQWGPWGTPGFFDRLKAAAPIRMTADTTIAIYKVSDIPTAHTSN